MEKLEEKRAEHLRRAVRNKQRGDGADLVRMMDNGRIGTRGRLAPHCGLAFGCRYSVATLSYNLN